jgi:hypothetical protein
LKGRFLIHENLLYTVDTRNGTPRKVVVPRELEKKLITYVHLEKGHAGTDKCVRIIQVNAMFHLRNLGRKTRILLALCEVCQKVKFPNWKYDVENRPHLPERTASQCGFLSTGSTRARESQVSVRVPGCFYRIHKTVPTEVGHNQGVPEENRGLQPLRSETGDNFIGPWDAVHI